MSLTKAERQARWRASEKGKKWEEDNKERLAPSRRAATKKRRLNGPTSYFLQQLRAKARRCGQEFTLTKQDLEEVLAPMVCSVTGIQLRHTLEAAPDAPSIDRIDNTKGIHTRQREACILDI